MPRKRNAATVEQPTTAENNNDIYLIWDTSDDTIAGSKPRYYRQLPWCEAACKKLNEQTESAGRFIPAKFARVIA